VREKIKFTRVFGYSVTSLACLMLLIKGFLFFFETYPEKPQIVFGYARAMTAYHSKNNAPYFAMTVETDDGQEIQVGLGRQPNFKKNARVKLEKFTSNFGRTRFAFIAYHTEPESAPITY